MKIILTLTYLSNLHIFYNKQKCPRILKILVVNKYVVSMETPTTTVDNFENISSTNANTYEDGLTLVLKFNYHNLYLYGASLNNPERVKQKKENYNHHHISELELL